MLPATHELSVTINGQQYTSPVSFHAYATPLVDAITPTTGPVDGKTALTILGGNFTGGSDYRCAFDDVLVPGV